MLASSLRAGMMTDTFGACAATVDDAGGVGFIVCNSLWRGAGNAPLNPRSCGTPNFIPTFANYGRMWATSQGTRAFVPTFADCGRM